MDVDSLHRLASGFSFPHLFMTTIVLFKAAPSCGSDTAANPLLCLASLLEPFPCLYLLEESISWAEGGHHLPMSMDGIVVLQLRAPHSTLHEVVSHQLQGDVVWDSLHVVPNVTDAKAFAVEASGVSTHPMPAPALVEVPITSHHKAVWRNRKLGSGKGVVVEMAEDLSNLPWISYLE